MENKGCKGGRGPTHAQSHERVCAVRHNNLEISVEDKSQVCGSTPEVGV